MQAVITAFYGAGPAPTHINTMWKAFRDRAEFHKLPVAHWRDTYLATFLGPAFLNPLKFSVLKGNPIEPILDEVYHAFVAAMPDALLFKNPKHNDDPLLDLLKDEYGPLYFNTLTASGSRNTINRNTLVAYLAFRSLIRFDENANCLMQYHPDLGVWKFLSDLAAYDLLLKLSADYYYATNRTISFTARDVDMIKAMSRATFPRQDRYLVVVQNGVVFVGEKALPLRPHSFTDYAKNQIPYPIGAASTPAAIVPASPVATGTTPAIPGTEKTKTTRTKARCTRFHQYLNGLIPLTDERDELQLWCGCVVLGMNPYHKICIITGGAKAGKSTLANIIESIVGSDNCASIFSERLGERFELSEFFAKTLLVGKDVQSSFLENDSSYMLKSLSGDRAIRAEVKHSQQRVVLEGPFNILLISNNNLRVKLDGDTEAWKRRLIVFETKPLPATTKVDPNFATDVVRDEGSGILEWMLEGAWRLQELIRKKDPWPSVATMAARRDALLEISDDLECFVSSKLEAAPTSKISTDDLYAEYEAFVPTKTLPVRPFNSFTRQIGRLLHRHFKAVHVIIPQADEIPRCKGYRGIKWK